MLLALAAQGTAQGISSSKFADNEGKSDTEDVVRVQSAKGDKITTWRGTIVQLVGDELQLKVGNTQRSLSVHNLVSYETTRTEAQIKADSLWQEHHYREALKFYDRAMKQEKRTWLRRELLARTIWCCKYVGDYGSAGTRFLLLLRSDVETRHFDAIPLAWTNEQLDESLDQRLRRWWDMEENPPAILMACSFLLQSTNARNSPSGSASSSSASSGSTSDNRGDHDITLSDIRRRLGRLSRSEDTRIAALALAQLWRTSAHTANAAEIARWRGTLPRFPSSIRAGGDFIVGIALARAGEHETSSLLLLRIPILYPRHRSLAASALLLAGQNQLALSQANRSRKSTALPDSLTGEAKRLFREVVDNYPDQPLLMAEARARLDQLSKQRE